MALTYEETIELEELKQKNKIEFEQIRHDNKMKELDKEINGNFTFRRTKE